jgi:L-asparaginase II
MQTTQTIGVTEGVPVNPVNAENLLDIIRDGVVPKPTYARSFMKPLQAIQTMEIEKANQYGFDEADLSLTCASHNGESQHTERIGTIIVDLQCEHMQEAYESFMESDEKITPKYNNCSGKHSGMLSTAKHRGESLEDYYKNNHPGQRRIMEVIRKR